MHVLVNTLEAGVLIGETEIARSLMRRLAPLAAEGWFYGPMINGVSFGRLLGDGAKLLGQTDDARRYYQQGLDYSGRIRFRPEFALTRLGLAELLLAHYPDERPAAIDHLDFAIAEFREMKMQPSLERALRHRGLLTA